MRSRFPVRAGVLAVTAAMLAACGSSDTDSAGDGSADAGESQAGGSATIMQHAEPRSLDPALGSVNLTAGSTLAGHGLYGHLVLAVPGESELEYGLAESLDSSDGGTIWQLTLRDGLTFSDGSPFDAADVQFNWERLADPAVAPSLAPTAALVESMTADGQTLTFTLTMPIAQFGHTIARTPLNWIAKPEALQAGNQAFDADPIGAGPFVLESWQRQGQMVLVRNDNYWDSPRPYLDRLVLIANGDGNQRLNTVLSGGADGLTASANDLNALAEEQGLQVHVDEAGSYAITMVLNTRIPPFDDIRARRAVSSALDLDAVAEATFGGTGEYEVPTTVFLPTDSPYNGDVTLPSHDREAAQELFDELAAEGRPMAFTLTAIQTTENRRTVEAMQAQLNQYDNVSVEVEVLDYPAWIAKFAQQTFQVAGGGLFQDPGVLHQDLHSSSAGNDSGIRDPDLDAALDAVLAATDEDARVQAYRDLAAVYVELLPTLSYVATEYAVITDDRLHGVEFYSFAGVRSDTLWVSE